MSTKPVNSAMDNLYLLEQRRLLTRWLRDHGFRAREAGPGYFICYQSPEDKMRVYLDIKPKEYLRSLGANPPAKQVYARLEIKGPDGFIMHSEEWDATPAWLENVLA